MKGQYAVVTGSGEFPFDMLRYDACYPALERQIRLLTDTAKVRSIIVQHSPSEQDGRWEPDRWLSFGWRLEKTFADKYAAEEFCHAQAKRRDCGHEATETHQGLMRCAACGLVLWE